MVRAILSKRGYHVLAVSNGPEALAALQQPDSPAIAILDVNMPGMTGLEVCKRIRESNQTAPTYIILLTANNSKTDLITGLESGADDYIIKPFDSEELCARVEVGVRIIELQRNLAEHVESLKVASEELKRGEEKYRSLIANIPDVTWTSDHRGIISFISPNIERIAGYVAEDLCGDRDFWGRVVHPEDAVRVEAAFRSLFEGNANFDINCRVRRADGEWMWIHNRAVATYERDGRMYADGVLTDITERKAFEEALRKSEAHLLRAQKLEAIGQLAAGIAHEINTPMQYLGDNLRFFQDSFSDLCRALAAYDKLMRASREASPPQEMFAEVETVVRNADVEYLLREIPVALEQSLEGVDRVTKIVQSMKDFAHPGADKKPADLNKAIESTITVARNEWKYVADLVMEFDPALPQVPCMVSEFNQVILNIIINAAHAITEVVGDGSRGKGTITITTSHKDGLAEIRIRDTGIGIPEKIRSRIFDPFFTTKEVGKGTGQGLAISHAVIVEKHGGTIDVESVVGQGTTFIVRLPIQQAQAAVAVI